jgi:hypothetical protein
MTAPFRLVEMPALDWPEHARIVHDPADIALIQNPNLNLVIWRRELTPALEALWRVLLTSRNALNLDCIAPSHEQLQDELLRYAP